MIFEEFFSVGAGLALKRRKAKSVPGVEFQVKDSARQAIRKILPFHPTSAQKRVLKEIVRRHVFAASDESPAARRRRLRQDHCRHPGGHPGD